MSFRVSFTWWCNKNYYIVVTGPWALELWWIMRIGYHGKTSLNAQSWGLIKFQVPSPQRVNSWKQLANSPLPPHPHPPQQQKISPLLHLDMIQSKTHKRILLLYKTYFYIGILPPNQLTRYFIQDLSALTFLGMAYTISLNEISGELIRCKDPNIKISFIY